VEAGVLAAVLFTVVIDSGIALSPRERPSSAER
jgi:hypothetical protein